MIKNVNGDFQNYRGERTMCARSSTIEQSAAYAFQINVEEDPVRLAVYFCDTKPRSRCAPVKLLKVIITSNDFINTGTY